MRSDLGGVSSPSCLFTRYTVMALSCLKVRFLAGLELYLHLDSTKRSRAFRAWSSETLGTLEEQTQAVGSTSLSLRGHFTGSEPHLTSGTKVFLLTSGWGL